MQYIQLLYTQYGKYDKQCWILHQETNKCFLYDKSDKVNTYTKTQDHDLLSEKQPVIGLNDLAISMTNGLLDAINSKHNLLPDKDCITLQQVATLETILGDLAPKTSVYTQGEIDDLLADKKYNSW